MPIKQIAAIRRKPGMTHAEFSTYVRNVHGEIAAAKPLGVERYVQNHVFDGAFGTSSDPRYAGVSGRDLVTELWFADGAALERTFADPYSQTVIREDGKTFNDFTTATAAVVGETALPVTTAGGGEFKIFYYLKFAAQPSDVTGAMRAAHDAGCAASAELTANVRECVASVPLDLGNNAKHFGGPDAPAFDAMLMLRFARESDLDAFRPYQRAFEGAAALDASQSFFVFTREMPIFDVRTGLAFSAAKA